MPDLNINNEVWETVDEEVRVAIQYLIRLREKMGLSDDTKLEGTKKNSSARNKTIFRYALEVYRVWGALFPQERLEFIENTKYELTHERPVQDSVKAGGYSPTSYPMRLDRLYGILLPGVKIQDKRFWKPMFSGIPELKRSNYA